jgi:GNAT superfamily N-acetyltransferase
MVGVLVMNVLDSISHAGEVGWIQQLYVRPDYRKKGLGNRMLVQALDWAGGRGLRAIDLEVGEGHDLQASSHLYKKHGFSEVDRTRMTRAFK